MANPRIQRDINDLYKELEEQIYLLESSIINFDQGHMEEGKRIATSMRILLHDTSQSHSLLGQLNIKDKLYYFDVVRYYEEIVLAVVYLPWFNDTVTAVKGSGCF